MLRFVNVEGKFIHVDNDYIIEFDELLDATAEYFEGGGDDMHFLLTNLKKRHEQLCIEFNNHKDPFRQAHRYHYVREGFIEAFGFYPN